MSSVFRKISVKNNIGQCYIKIGKFTPTFLHIPAPAIRVRRRDPPPVSGCGRSGNNNLFPRYGAGVYNSYRPGGLSAWHPAWATLPPRTFPPGSGGKSFESRKSKVGAGKSIVGAGKSKVVRGKRKPPRHKVGAVSAIPKSIWRLISILSDFPKVVSQSRLKVAESVSDSR